MSDIDVASFSADLRNIAKTLNDIQVILRDLEKRLRDLERSDAGTHPVMLSRIDAAWRKIEEHSDHIKSAEEQIASMREANKLLAWLGGILGSTLIIWLLTQLLKGI